MIDIANIKDVAQKAGVSVATVSHVINRTRYVSDELIKKVEKAMQDLNYKPNLLAGSLRKKKTGTIGLIIPDSSNLIFAELSKNLEDLFFSKNHNIIVSNSAYSLKREMESLNTLISKRVDGVLIIPATVEFKHIQAVQDLGVSVIVIDRKMIGMNVDTIFVDNYRGGVEAAKYLIKMGHKKIGYIDRFKDHSHSIDRKKGFMDILKENGIELNEKNITRGGFTFESAIDAVKILLGRNQGITALYSFNDIIALGAIRGLVDLGFKIPDDISVMGNDDISLSKIFIPRLTTMHYPIKEIAEEAAKLLLKRIKNPDFKKPHEIKIFSGLVIRDSVGPV